MIRVPNKIILLCILLLVLATFSSVSQDLSNDLKPYLEQSIDHWKGRVYGT